MKNLLIVLLTLWIFTNCNDVNQKVRRIDISDTLIYHSFFNPVNAKDSLVNDTVVSKFHNEFKLMPDFKISVNKGSEKDVKSLVGSTSSYIPISFSYIETSGTYVSNLDNLVERSITVYRSPNMKNILVVGADYKVDTFTGKHRIIENGKLTDYKITRQNRNDLNFILGSVSIENNSMYNFLINEVAEITINDKLLDLNKLKNAYT